MLKKDEVRQQWRKLVVYRSLERARPKWEDVTDMVLREWQVGGTSSGFGEAWKQHGLSKRRYHNTSLHGV